MNSREVLRRVIGSTDFLVNAYLEDLTDADLLVRPAPGANHIAWQMGHLICSEHGMMSARYPGTMPPLPSGFVEKHKNETASSDDPVAFHSKSEYLRLYKEQRAGTLANLAKVTDEELDQPAPEQFRSFLETVADLFYIQGNHALMHAGQWVIVRRKLGRKPLF